MKKRAEQTGRYQSLEQQIKQIDSDVAAIGQVARLFDPSILPIVVPRKRARGQKSILGSEHERVCPQDYREAKEPISTTACSATIARIRANRPM